VIQDGETVTFVINPDKVLKFVPAEKKEVNEHSRGRQTIKPLTVAVFRPEIILHDERYCPRCPCYFGPALE
jgi:hypothetical protein